MSAGGPRTRARHDPVVARGGPEAPGTLERSMIVMAVVAVLAALAAGGQSLLGLGVLAGILLTIWAPGAALLLALGATVPLHGMARQALALPVSLAVVAVLAVVLERARLGLHAQTLTLAVLVTIVAFLGLAMARRRASSHGTRRLES